MHLRILKSGLLTTIQAGECRHLRSVGVPLGGPADWLSHQIVNALLQNDPDAGVLEIVPGAGWRAEVADSGWFAVFGPGGYFFMDGQPVSEGQPFWAASGAVIEARTSGVGVYVYLGVAGGFNQRSTLETTELHGVYGVSRSAANSTLTTHNPKLETTESYGVARSEANSKLKTRNPKLETTELHGVARSFTERDKPETQNPKLKTGNPELKTQNSKLKTRQNPKLIRVLPGPEQHLWTESAVEVFFQTIFCVSAQHNRMGARLEGGHLPPPAAASSMWSTGVAPGTVQVPPDGRPIVLLADAQTTGGYPRFGQVIWADVWKVAQSPAGTALQFVSVGLEEAEEAYFLQHQFIRRLRLGVKMATDG